MKLKMRTEIRVEPVVATTPVVKTSANVSRLEYFQGVLEEMRTLDVNSEDRGRWNGSLKVALGLI